MDLFIEFVKSDMGVSIAWLCSIIGFTFSFFKRKENKTLKKKIIKLEQINIDLSNDAVSQKGKKNVYTKNNAGDMNINM